MKNRSQESEARRQKKIKSINAVRSLIILASDSWLLDSAVRPSFEDLI
jgi:hypothetical protein